ncbi:cytochrome P450 monooxygenase 9 [Actinomortierella wolfii]|nr:cytochrome P450 monooxygenase 9 [Actinomortierella wolfii]
MATPEIPADYIPIVEGQLWKKILREGTGESPMQKATVDVHYVGTLWPSGDKFDSSRDRGSTFSFKLGVGWDEGVKTMKVGELADLICAPDYAYGATGSPPKIPGNSTLKFEVELLDFHEPADTPAAKMALAQKKKEEGNTAFKAGDNAKAALAYNNGYEALRILSDFTPEMEEEARALKGTLLSNLAAAQLKTQDYAKAIDSCQKALDFQKNNAKIYYRLAQGYLGISEFEQAREMVKKGQEIAPEDASFKSVLSSIAAKEAAYRKKEKETYQKMFG